MRLSEWLRARKPCPTDADDTPVPEPPCDAEPGRTVGH
jgi:hypothetical protein